jgi:hypothetical protein
MTVGHLATALQTAAKLAAAMSARAWAMFRPLVEQAPWLPAHSVRQRQAPPCGWRRRHARDRPQAAPLVPADPAPHQDQARRRRGPSVPAAQRPRRPIDSGRRVPPAQPGRPAIRPRHPSARSRTGRPTTLARPVSVPRLCREARPTGTCRATHSWMDLQLEPRRYPSACRPTRIHPDRRTTSLRRLTPPRGQSASCGIERLGLSIGANAANAGPGWGWPGVARSDRPVA